MKKLLPALILAALCIPAKSQVGTLDLSFGTQGFVRTIFPGSASTSYYASAIQPDGKIVTVGTANNDFAIARYNTDGTLDNSFSGDGMMTIDFGFGSDAARGVAIQPDGKIVVAGTGFNGLNTDFAVARLNPDGTPDNSFSGDGKLLTDLRGFNDGANAVSLQPDGKIVVAGNSIIGLIRGSQDFAVARYNTDGTLDNSFSGDGIQITSFSPNDFATALIIQPDGKIVVAGIFFLSNFSGITHIAVARYNSDGSLDASFDGDGMLTTDINGRIDEAYAIALQVDGKIIVAGASGTFSSGSDFVIVRYNSNGSLDNSFSGDGILIMDLGSTFEGFSALAIQSDGKIIAGGTTRNLNIGDFVLVRLHPDGTPDNSFSGDGIEITDFENSSDILYSLNIWNNRVYAAGTTAYGGLQHGILTAYLLEDSPIPCTINVIIPDTVTLSNGVDPNTVYLGYGPASDLTLSVLASGGTEPYTYLWSNGASSSSITVTPVVPTTYSVTVTTASGCSSTVSKFVNVVDVRCGNKLDKVLICLAPAGNPSNASAHCISASAVAGFLDKGSYLGNCTAQTYITMNGSKNVKASEKPVPAFSVTASPNPSGRFFTLEISSSEKRQAELVVRDVSGKLVERKMVLVNGTVQLGSTYRPGVYFIELRQGREKATLKLMKLAD